MADLFDLLTECIGFDWDENKSNKNWVTHQVLWIEAEEAAVDGIVDPVICIHQSPSSPPYGDAILSASYEDNENAVRYENYARFARNDTLI